MLSAEVDCKFLLLTLKIILEQSRKRQPIHINFQHDRSSLLSTGTQLFIELANEIYINYPDQPPDYKVGEKCKNKRDNKYYEIIETTNNKYTLEEVLRQNQKNRCPCKLIGKTYSDLSKDFVKINANAGIRESTIKNYFNFFKELNKAESDFLQINYFERKSVYIAKKTFWDELSSKSKIPSIYLPNPREESDHHELKSIPALPDCIMYITPKYEICYQSILRREKKIDTIIVCDTEEDKIQQMIQDKNQFGFNLILLTNSINPIKSNQIPCWNWFKEEIEIVNSL